MEEYKAKKAAGELPPVEALPPKVRKAPVKKKVAEKVVDKPKEEETIKASATDDSADNGSPLERSREDEDEEISFTSVKEKTNINQNNSHDSNDEVEDAIHEMEIDPAAPPSNIIEEDEEKTDDNGVSDPSMKFTVYTSFETNGDNADSDSHTMKRVPEKKFVTLREATRHLRKIFYENHHPDLSEDSMKKENIEEIVDTDGLITLIYHLPSNKGTWKVGVQETK
jgi:hypothetical protein